MFKSKKVSWEEKSVDIKGVKTHYLVGGSGMPLLLIHGWPLAFYPPDSLQDNFLSKASQCFRVYAPDLPGFGQSEKADFPPDIHKYADFLTRFRKTLKIKKHAVVGWSFGGMVAVKYAALNCEDITALVLCATAVSAKHIANHFLKRLFKTVNFACERIPLVEDLFEKLLKNDKILAWSWQKITPLDPSFSFENDPSILSLKKLPVSFSRQIFQSGIKVNLKKDCHLLKNTPVFILSGEKDRLMTVEAGKEIDQLVGEAHFLIVPSTEHWNVLNQDSIEIILAFLKDISHRF